MCFACRGEGTYDRKVSSIRAAERRRVREHNKYLAATRTNADDYALSVEDGRLSEVYDRLAEAHAEQRAAASYAEGEKFSGVPATVQRTFLVEGLYGSSRGVILTDTDGVELAWFGSVKAIWKLEPGNEITLSGVVKKVGTYEGEPSVKVTRCKVSNPTPV